MTPYECYFLPAKNYFANVAVIVVVFCFFLFKVYWTLVNSSCMWTQNLLEKFERVNNVLENAA